MGGDAAAQGYSIAVDEAPAEADVRAIHTGLDEYNRQQGAPPVGYWPLRIFLRAQDGSVAGGLLGGSFWGWLHVEIFWLHEAARGQDYGTRMLALAEQEALRRGCHHAYVDTVSFQALPFYLKQGYTVWGELEDFPAGYTRHFLQKKLR
jgi:GNAT superfamily N-acetyltransferase